MVANRGDVRRQRERCFDSPGAKDNHSESILALDLTSGEIRWARKMVAFDVWTLACRPDLVPLLPSNAGNCPYPEGAFDFDFGQAPMLITAETADGPRDLVVAGQKTGVVWVLDPDASGETVWATQVGPSNQAGETVRAGIWAAVDAATGELLWQTPDPGSAAPLRSWRFHPI